MITKANHALATLSKPHAQNRISSPAQHDTWGGLDTISQHAEALARAHLSSFFQPAEEKQPNSGHKSQQENQHRKATAQEPSKPSHKAITRASVTPISAPSDRQGQWSVHRTAKPTWMRHQDQAHFEPLDAVSGYRKSVPQFTELLHQCGSTSNSIGLCESVRRHRLTNVNRCQRKSRHFPGFSLEVTAGQALVALGGPPGGVNERMGPALPQNSPKKVLRHVG